MTIAYLTGWPLAGLIVAVLLVTIGIPVTIGLLIGLKIRKKLKGTAAARNAMMQSDIELPVTFRPPRLLIAVYFLVSFLLLGLGYSMVIGWVLPGWTMDGIPIYWIGWFFIVVSPIWAVVCLLQLLPNATYLRLTPEGFTTCVLFRAHSTRWDDVQEFGVTKKSRAGVVGWNYVPGKSMPGSGHTISQASFGYEATLSHMHGMNPEELVVILEKLRRQYAGNIQNRSGPTAAPRPSTTGEARGNQQENAPQMQVADIKFNCPECRQKLAVEQSFAGATVNCPSCSHPLIVPAG